MAIRIFIIDEHPAAREMLARRLSSLPDMDILGTTGDGGDGLRQIKLTSVEAAPARHYNGT